MDDRCSILIHTQLDEDTGSYRGPIIVRHQDLAWNAEKSKRGPMEALSVGAV